MILGPSILKTFDPPIISPFCQRTKHNGLTYGLGHAGYDVRCDQNLPLPPGTFRVASTIETFHMPSNVLGIVHDKSTWARTGLAVQNTVIEPGWRGHLTLELTNHSGVAIFINKGDPICQVVFHFIQGAETTYEGKYQDQKRGPQPAIFDKE
jgi:dCTP deaminase